MAHETAQQLRALVALVGMTGAILLAADDPAALAQFYGGLLDVEPLPGLSATHWRVPWPAGGFLELYAPSRSRPQAVLNDWAQAALAMGASLLEPPRQEPLGAELWPLDLEGNRLLLLLSP